MSNLGVEHPSVAMRVRAGRACRELLTPLGKIRVVAGQEGVTSVEWVDDQAAHKLAGQFAEVDHANAAQVSGPGRDQAAELELREANGQTLSEHWADQAVAELVEYFQGRRKSFSVPVTLCGTPFQTAVWDALTHIPYGVTQSYRDIATAIGNPRAVRAVGQANRANPVSVIVPCHRVIGANGALVGYAGTQVDLKARLLELERAWQ